MSSTIRRRWSPSRSALTRSSTRTTANRWDRQLVEALRETIPPFTTWSAADSDPAWSCSGTSAGSTCSLPLGPLAAGAELSKLFALRVVDNPPALVPLQVGPHVLTLKVSNLSGIATSALNVSVVPTVFSDVPATHWAATAIHDLYFARRYLGLRLLRWSPPLLPRRLHLPR